MRYAFLLLLLAGCGRGADLPEAACNPLVADTTVRLSSGQTWMCDCTEEVCEWVVLAILK